MVRRRRTASRSSRLLTILTVSRMRRCCSLASCSSRRRCDARNQADNARISFQGSSLSGSLERLTRAPQSLSPPTAAFVRSA